MINKNEVKNIVICKYYDGKKVIHIYTKSGYIYTLDESGKDIETLCEEVLGPKIQYIIENDMKYQNDIHTLETAKTIAIEQGNFSYVNETEKLISALHSQARKRAMESLINKDTIYIVTPEEYIRNITNFQRKNGWALDQTENESSYNQENDDNYEDFIREYFDKKAQDKEKTKTKTKKRTTESPTEDEKISEETGRKPSNSDSSSKTRSFEHGFVGYTGRTNDSSSSDDRTENDPSKRKIKTSDFIGRIFNLDDTAETYEDESEDEEDMHSQDGYATYSSSDDKTENKPPKRKLKTSDFVGGTVKPEETYESSEDAHRDAEDSSERTSDEAEPEEDTHSNTGRASEDTPDEAETERTSLRGRFSPFESEDNQKPIGDEEDTYEEEPFDDDDDEYEAESAPPKRKLKVSDFTRKTFNPETTEKSKYEPEDKSEETYESSEGTHNDTEGSSERTLDGAETEEDTHSNTEGTSEATSDEAESDSTETDEHISPEDDDFDIEKYKFDTSRPIGDDDDDDYDFGDDDEEENTEENSNNEAPKKEGIIKRLINKIKKSPIGVKIAAIAVSAAMIFGLGAGLHSCSKRQTLEGTMNNSNIASMSNFDESENNIDGIKITGDNSTYNNLTVQQLLDATTNKAQKDSMSNLHTSIIGFNQAFADAHAGSYQSESGETINVRAALSFDEMVALQQAYNDYSKTELKAYFNGADIDKDTITRAYKDASLQLMGAYVIETNENPVDMSGLINTDEGKEFYNRYHQMFLAAKTATGDDKLEKIKAFYTAVKQDFPITQEVRTEGIAHADDYASLASYKLSVAPMIAAGEMMWQNYEVDETLDDSTIDFLNDLGLCNYAENKFEKIEMISLTSESDSTNPLYEQYKEAFEKELKEQNIYVIDDEHRELSKLQEFQDAVNWHFENGEIYSYSSGVTMTSSETYQEISSYQTSSTSYTTEQTRENVDASQVPEDVKKELDDKVDSEIASENDQAKQEAEKKAEEAQKEMQTEEDKKADQIEEEVKKDDEKLQDQIDQANDTINDNNKDQDSSNDNKVNESDFDGNVDFDDDHSDENGNLDDSVKDITTDGTGDQTGEELPDPNQTGSEFDRKASSEDASSSTSQPEETPSTSTDGSSNNTFEYEEVIDEYFNQMESQNQVETESHQYTK